MLKNFILSQRDRKAHYLLREIAKYVSSGEEFRGGNMGGKRKADENRIEYVVN